LNVVLPGPEIINELPDGLTEISDPKPLTLKEQLYKAFSEGNIDIDPKLNQKESTYIGKEAPTLGASKFDTNVPVSIAETPNELN
jgi:hypothetical protein